MAHSTIASLIAGDALATDYTLLGGGGTPLALDGDTGAIHQELGIPRTPIDEWAHHQDWDAAAAVAAAT